MYGPPIEQAIFTSLRGRELDGYQLAVASPGVTAEEAQELTVWGPAHDSLLDPQPGARSINFHRLASGRFCISLTTALGAEYSGRGGCQVYTHNLVVAPDVLLRFANDPFRLLEAVLAADRLRPHEKIPPALESFPLLGGASAVNGALLARLIRQPGPAALGRLLEAALTNTATAVISRTPANLLLAGLLNLLPVECRVEFPFTTGLRPSPRRTFRLLALTDDAPERRRPAHTLPFALIHLDGAITQRTTRHAWADYIASELEQNRLPQLTAALRQPRPNTTANNLENLAHELASL